MGLFSSIGKVFSTAATAVATGGLSLVAPKLIPKPISQALNVITKAQFPTNINQALNTLALTPQGRAFLPTVTVAGKAVELVASGGKLVPKQQTGGAMALDVGGILKQVGGIFGGNQNPIFETISGVSNIASQFFPQSGTALVAAKPKPAMVMAGPVMRAAGAMVTRGFFNRFPNLALAIQQLRARGIAVKRSQLWAMLKRFGPEVLITGGLLTAAAVSELMVAGPGHRRMNPANVRALRRSMRRLKSFDRLAAGVSRQLSRGGISRGRRRTSRRCVTCRKNPCAC